MRAGEGKEKLQEQRKQLESRQGATVGSVPPAGLQGRFRFDFGAPEPHFGRSGVSRGGRGGQGKAELLRDEQRAARAAPLRYKPGPKPSPVINKAAADLGDPSVAGVSV